MRGKDQMDQAEGAESAEMKEMVTYFLVMFRLPHRAHDRVFSGKLRFLESLVHQMTGWRDGETEGAGLSVI